MDEPEQPPTTDARDGPADNASLVARARAGKDRVVDRAVVARDQLESARHRSSALDAALQTMEHDSEIGGGVLAAAVGFRVFLFLVPYVFVWVAGFGVASQASSKSPQAAARAAGITGLIARSLGDFGKLSTGQRFITLAIGLFALVIAARGLVKTLTIVHVLVWGDVDRRKVSATKGTALLVGLVTVAVVLSGIVSWLRSESFVAGLFGIALFMAVPFALWLAVSWLLPHAPHLPWWALLPGAAVLAIGVEVLHVVTVYWISREVSNKADRYGALGVALALLLWSYLLGRLVVAATVTNASLWRRNVGRAAEATPPAQRARPPGDASEPPGT